MQRLPILGETVYRLLFNMADNFEVESKEQGYRKKIDLIEEASQYVVSELRNEGLSDSVSDFLIEHGPSVQSRIRDPEIRNLNVWIEW